MEINGFEIDQYNQYDLKDGADLSTCPLCSHSRSHANQKKKCASLDWDRGLGTCHHCDEIFQLHTFKRKGGGTKQYTKPEIKGDFLLSEKVVEWFKGRGISQEILTKMKITEGEEFMPQTEKAERTIQFNYFINGELINTKFRDARKNFKLAKGAEKVFYNLDSTVGSDTVVIVEGEIDALSVIESGIKYVVSVPNGATTTRLNLDYLDNCIDYFLDKSKIILALDSDEPGQNLQQEFIRRFGAEVCYTVDFGGHKDANEFLEHYGSDQLRDVILGANACPLENVTTVKDIHGELTDFVSDGFKPGYKIGLDSFDDIFSTYTGQFCTVTGIPSSGKSDFVDQMCVGYNKNYGWKVAYASPENHPIYLHAHKLIRKIGDWMPQDSDVGGEKWNKIVENVNDNYFFIDMERYTLEATLKKAAELVQRKGIKVLVLDPFNKITMKGKGKLSVVDYTSEYLQKIDEFCRKYDVFVIIVAHPTKMYKGADGNIDEPTMYSIKGGGEWYDSSFHGLLVHRNYEQKTVKVKVLKVKFQNLGNNGDETHLSWNPKSGRYEELTKAKSEGLPF